MIIEQLFLVHAGILGVIGFALLVIGNLIGVYWRRRKQLAKGKRRIHGYLTLSAYVLSVAHIGQGLSAYVQLARTF